MNQEARRRFDDLKAGGLLPSPKGVALSILDATGRSGVGTSEIARLVQLDPAISGRLLRYANAAHGGSLRHVASVTQAVAFLGLFRVRQITLGFSLIDQYRSGACKAFDYEGYWTRSLATGIAAQKLAPLAQSPPDESFSCGLLAAIGQLGLATAFPDEYGRIIDSGSSGLRLIEDERRHFGIDHAQLSAEMLESWGLPQIFTDAVRHHEHPADGAFAPGTRAHALCAALHFATRIGQLLNLDEPHRWKQVPSLFHAAAQVGMEDAEVPSLVEDVVAGWQSWAQELDLPARSYSDLRALLTAPPVGVGSTEVNSPDSIPLRVAVLVQDSTARQALADRLQALSAVVTVCAAPEYWRESVSGQVQDVVVVDAGCAAADDLALMVQLKHLLGDTVHLLAFIPSLAEPMVSALMAAGATDYLLYEGSDVALSARLAGVQRLIALQGVVRAERELAVSSSGEWARSNRRLLHEALTDPLTQLPNRRYGLDRFAQEWSVAASNTLAMACLMIDIDHFKRVNDQYGHAAGDQVLTQVAGLVERNCRRNDVVFRYGGEEFCVICPATTGDEVLPVAERIAQAIRESEFGAPGAGFGLTVSIGVALKSAQMAEPADLIRSADQALYRAKETGRNRIVMM